MGGPGSGRWWDHEPRPLTGDYPVLDIRAWYRAGRLARGTHWRSSARRGDTDDPVSIEVVMLDDQFVIMWWPTAGAAPTYALVPWVETPCTYGGTRPWFTCPGVTTGWDCGRRVANLYLVDDVIRCRRCLGLAYASQREDLLAATARRARAARRPLRPHGAALAPFAPLPPRPRGMHRRTYARIRDAVTWADLMFGVEAVEELRAVNQCLAQRGGAPPPPLPERPAFIDDVRRPRRARHLA